MDPINIPPMLAYIPYIPYMDPMGNKPTMVESPWIFCWTTNSGQDGQVQRSNRRTPRRASWSRWDGKADGYGSIPMKIPFLGGWTSINPSYFYVHQGYKVLTHCQIMKLWSWRFTGWWWLEPWNFEWLSRNSWECHHHWQTHFIIVQRGRLKPPTRLYYYPLLNLQWKTTIFTNILAWHDTNNFSTTQVDYPMTSHRDVPGIKPCHDRRGEWRNPPVMTSVISVIYTSKIHPIYTVDGPSDMLLHHFFTIFSRGCFIFQGFANIESTIFVGDFIIKHIFLGFHHQTWQKTCYIVLMKTREKHVES